MYLLLLSLAISAVTAFDDSSHLEARQTSNTTCLAECAVPLNITQTCPTNPDPYCGCSDLIPAAPGCKSCLITANVTLLGFLSPPYIDFSVAVCECQIPTCRDLILAERACAVSNPNDTACACPATLKDAPVCYGCLKNNTNDTIVNAGLDARVAFCQANASSSASASASATASQTAIPTFTSEAAMEAVSKLVCVGFVLAATIVMWM